MKQEKGRWPVEHVNWNCSATLLMSSMPTEKCSKASTTDWWPPRATSSLQAPTRMVLLDHRVAQVPWRATTTINQIADDVNINLLQRHKRIDVIKQHFWRRFANDYVFTLQQKSKWLTSSSPSLKVDSLVLVKDKVNPPLMWCLGRVTRLYPGPDGINRVADVKTRRGTLRRGWNNLCPLPMDQDL
ncbi:uncharacterized protein isoform X2 [Choristoneura fumiferana]|uniref:uncharacterized protein isoform X2 n=1 Tax=Choristoneura fumiferana TaxID=7141 RepID=UPI003D15DEC9